LPEPGPALAQAVFDAMFADMEQNLRELGVGDMSIPRRVRAMWEAFHGRALAYDPPLNAGDQAALAAALTRNVWRGAAPAGAAARLAAAAMAQDRHLEALAVDHATTGQAEFLAAADTLPAATIPVAAA
jgi:cytochrome b pre-mRNA-processing protein 3